MTGEIKTILPLVTPESAFKACIKKTTKIYTKDDNRNLCTSFQPGWWKINEDKHGRMSWKRATYDG